MQTQVGYPQAIDIEYGGIYLDTDQLLLRSVDAFRNKDCTLGWAADFYFGSDLILAKKRQRLSESGLKVTPRIIQRQFCDNGHKTIYQVTKL